MSFGIPVRNGLGVGLLASTFLSSRRAAYPAMSLNFLQPFLDSRITFSRGSNATLVDATGKIVYAPANLLLYSQSLATSPWENGIAGTGVTPTVTDNAGVAPDGTTTATRLQLSLGGGTSATDLSRRRQPVTVQAVAHIFSVWIRSTDGTSSYNIHLQDAINATRNITVTGTWTRYDASAVSPGTLSYLSVGLRGGQAPANSNTADLLVWGAQLEPVTYQTTPSTYVATTASAYYGPRFDYDPVTLAPKGLLIEEQRTNLLRYSEQLDSGSAWTNVSGTTVTSNTSTSPAGDLTADTVNFSATNGNRVEQSSGTAVNGETLTFSVYLRGSGSMAINVGTDTGAGGSTEIVVNLTSTWTRYSATVTYSSPTGLRRVMLIWRTGNTATSVQAWGAQLEAGAFATSYIPTVASQVTRTADVTNIVAPNFAPWYNPSEGTLVAEFSSFSIANNTRAATLTDGVNRVADIYVDVNVWRTYNGTTAVNPGGNTAVLGAVVKFAAAYKSGDYAAAMNGGSVGTATTAGVQSANKLTIGANIVSANFLNGHIRSIKYYPFRASNNQLQALTT